MKLIRFLIGNFLLFLDFVFSPKKKLLTEKDQLKLNKLTSGLSLYQYKTCPFCIKVRRMLKRNSIQINIINVKDNQKFKNELKLKGGKLKVPCLKIQKKIGMSSWLYESNDIIKYIEKKIKLFKGNEN